MTYPFVRELAAEDVLTATKSQELKMARQPHCWRLGHLVSRCAWVQPHQLNGFVDAHQVDPGYEYRQLQDEAEQAGRSMNRRTAWKLMLVAKPPASHCETVARAWGHPWPCCDTQTYQG